MPDSGWWRPHASLEVLRARARMLGRIRAFFDTRGVWEVETPLLAAACASDPHLQAVCLTESPWGPRYWQTSPEAHMKRLLAAGSGAIFQIYRAARAWERGRFHHPEFTLLEWYRPGFDHHALMIEIDLLVRALLADDLQLGLTQTLTYREAFQRQAAIDPFAIDAAQCRARLGDAGVSLSPGTADLDLDGWLDLIMTHCVAPQLGRSGLCFITDYPVSQAAMARVLPGEPPVAARFEMYLYGVELANGYHELSNEPEQRARIEADLARRAKQGLHMVPVDEALLAALAAGFPDCAGVALGLDRLLMIATGVAEIDAVLAFPVERA